MNCRHNALLVLETGDYFLGQKIGQPDTVGGVLCFTTSMTGYQETITDPSYAGQLLVFTFPHIGNVGTNDYDWENRTPALKGIILSDLITPPSNYRSQLSFDEWITAVGISGIARVDTRSLVKIIREISRPIRAVIKSLATSTFSETLIRETKEQAAKVSTLEARFVDLTINEQNKPHLFHDTYLINQEDKPYNGARRIIVLNYGIKASIVRNLKEQGCEVFLLSPTVSLQEILQLEPHGIVLSNGPGDPRSYNGFFTLILQKLLELKIPMLAICFGYQLLALALGAKIKKLPCGHHGTNHPVRDLRANKILITSQNHEFTVDESSLPDNIVPTFRSLFDNSLEGFEVTNKPMLAVQFHPEANPGPSDAVFLFKEFIELINAQTH